MTMTGTKLSPQALYVLGNQASEDLQPQDIEEDLYWLEHHDLTPLPDSIMSFLEKYSGIKFSTTSNHYGSQMDVSFGLSEAGKSGGLKEIVEDAEVFLGQSFYPIGAMYEIELEQPLCRDRLILLLAEDGSIYSYCSNVIQKEGENVNDFVNRVVADQPLGRESRDNTVNYSDRDPRLKEIQKQRIQKHNAKRRKEKNAV
jgi:hypothetical protein